MDFSDRDTGTPPKGVCPVRPVYLVGTCHGNVPPCPVSRSRRNKIMKCLDCGYDGPERTPADRKRHRAIHDMALHGIPDDPLTALSEKVIWPKIEKKASPFAKKETGQKDDPNPWEIFPPPKITVITPYSSLKQRKLARTVARFANREMNYDGGIYNEYEQHDKRNLHLFLYAEKGRFLGLAKFELRSNILRYTRDEFDRRIKKDDSAWEREEPIWSVGFIWTHQKHRRHTVAQKLVMEASNHLQVPLEQLGLYAPLSPSGEQLARELFKDQVIFVR